MKTTIRKAALTLLAVGTLTFSNAQKIAHIDLDSLSGIMPETKVAKGVAENYGSKGKHIVTIATEHTAVLDTCGYLESKGFEVTYLPVKTDGLIDLNELKNVLRTDTILLW